MKGNRKMKPFIQSSKFAALLWMLTVQSASEGGAVPGPPDERQPVDCVNPNIGGIPPLLAATVPLVHLPNSMMRVHRMPGDFLAEKISHFPLVVCGHRAGSVGCLMPTAGEPPRNRTEWESAIDHDLETCTPNYYSVRLETHDIRLELAVAEKSAFYLIQWNRNDEKHLMLSLTSKGEITVRDDHTVEGHEVFHGKLKVFFHVVTDRRFAADSLRTQDQAGAGSETGGHPGVCLTFDIPESRKLGVKIGISFIDAEQARKNLRSEIPEWDFEGLRQSGRDRWNAALDRIKVKGADDNQTAVFYTALYRTYERPVAISEDGRYYSGYDDAVHDDGGIPFYADDWMWDTYRASHPLQALLNPELEGLKIQSYVRMYEQSGWMPSFPMLTGDVACMNGHHSAAIITDAYLKGIRSFDVEKAYEGLKKNAFEATMLPWRNGPMCSLDSFYLEKGYYPALKPGEKETVSQVHGFEKRQAVAVTLGHSYDDWCLARLAKALGRTGDAEVFLRRSGNYQNLYNPATGFFEPRTEDGRWIEDFDPKFSGGVGGRDYYDEANGWTYLWDVQHDIAGLIGLMGGRGPFIQKLDRLFVEDHGGWKPAFLNQFPDATGLVGQFVMGNEPSLHIPYLYNYAGQPWKTQKRVRMLLDTWFTNSSFGIPGDEDGGGLSAFAVFSSLGIYPVTPGAPAFNITSPIFTESVISVNPAAEFRIRAKNCSRRNKYIQKAVLNGREWNKPWLEWASIRNGGELTLEMGERPNRSWGSNPDDAPPSAVDLR